MSLHHFFSPDETGHRVKFYFCNSCQLDLPIEAYAYDSGGNKRRSQCRKCDYKHKARARKIRKQIEHPSNDYTCPICERNSKEIIGSLKLKTLKMKSAWVVDHDHSNGNFRGWVCGKCNRALGNFGDDLTKVRNAVKYLENYHG